MFGLRKMGLAVMVVASGFQSAVLAEPDDITQLSCMLEPNSHVEVSSQVPGVVEKMSAERGAFVRKGQVLMVLKSGVEEVALESALARAEFAERKYTRNSELLRKRLLSDFERDELVTEMKLGELAVKDARARLEQRTVKSPIKGVVISRNVSVGEFVRDNSVVELVALDPLFAEVVLSEDYYGSISKGMKVIVSASGPVSVEREGEVIIVDPVIDAASSTFGVRVKIDNSDFSVPAGVKCQVSLVGANPP